MKKFKLLVAFFVLNLIAFASFAEGYHVCVASYQKLGNAQEMVQKLEKQSISAIISESKAKNQTLYRVLLAKEFKKIEDARKYRDEVQKYSFVRELGLKDFWVCQSEKIVSKQASAPKVTPKPAPAAKSTPKPKTPAPKKVAPKPQPKKVAPKPVEEPKPIEEPPVQENPAKNEIPVPVPVPTPIPEPTPAPEPAPATEVIVTPPASEESNTLDKNEKAVLSEATPYSVLVRSYKYNQFAENDKNRLNELGFDAYLLNTFDDKSFFAFNIHVGAFSNRAAAEALQNQFTDAGILDTKISDYNEIKPKIEKYDEIISQQKVTFDDGQPNMPSSIPPYVEKIIQQIPANKDFPIQEITILDCENYDAVQDKPDVSAELLKYIGYEKDIHAAILAVYRDELYRKEVSIFFASAEGYTFTDRVGTPEMVQFAAKNGSFDCDLYENNGELNLCGENLSERLFIQVKTKDFTKEEFITFLTDSFKGNSLDLYPQIRRTLFVIPDQNPSVSRNFISFNFKKVDDSYAEERGNADWATQIVGHSLANTYYAQNEALICLGFYDLDYDFNAKSIHAHFMEVKNAIDISENNQPISINGVDGWYLLSPKQSEVSFSTKSYVVAIDTEPYGRISKEDLIQLGTELKIWDSANARTPIIDAK